ncbi:MAG: hypothetical protein KDJ65_08540 [Anaerolineae bacterium]|nr:hypothetical protein [Anaerolineae bacterium]
MTNPSVAILTEHQKAQMERLVMLRDYQKLIDDPYVKSALIFVIEDTQEAIARGASRLRQVGAMQVSKFSEDVNNKLLRQGRQRRGLGDKIWFIYNGLQHQLQWYERQIKALVDDADTQATFVALAEQLRVRIDRWRNLMIEMKVPLDK